MSSDTSQQDDPVSATETPHKFSYKFGRNNLGTRTTSEKIFHNSPITSSCHSSAFDIMDLPATLPATPFIREMAETLSDDEELFNRDELLQSSRSYSLKTPTRHQDKDNDAESQPTSDQIKVKRNGSDVCMQPEGLELTNISEAAMNPDSVTCKYLYSFQNINDSSDCAIIEPSYPIVTVDDSSSDDDLLANKRDCSQSLPQYEKKENELPKPTAQTISLNPTVNKSLSDSTVTKNKSKTNFQTDIKSFFDNGINKNKLKGRLGDFGSMLNVEDDQSFLKQETISTRKNEADKVEIRRKQNMYWIAGIQVEFPGKPYGVQMAVMEKVCFKE